MAIHSIDSALWTVRSSQGPKFRGASSSSDFAEVFQDVVQKKNEGGEREPDTFESTTGTVGRTTLNKARKLDADGTSIDSLLASRQGNDEEFKKVFHQFAGQTLYGHMLKSMRETQQKPAYFHGGRAEEIFQGQLDQVLVEKMTAATSTTLSETMFNLMKKP